MLLLPPVRKKDMTILAQFRILIEKNDDTAHKLSDECTNHDSIRIIAEKT